MQLLAHLATIVLVGKSELVERERLFQAIAQQERQILIVLLVVQDFIQTLALDPVFLAPLVHMDLIAVLTHAYLVQQEHTHPLQVRLVHQHAQLAMETNTVSLELHLVHIVLLDLLFYLLHSDVRFNH